MQHPVTSELITDKTRIAKRYLRTWFWIDLLATFPSDYIVKGLEVGSSCVQLQAGRGGPCLEAGARPWWLACYCYRPIVVTHSLLCGTQHQLMAAHNAQQH